MTTKFKPYSNERRKLAWLLVLTLALSVLIPAQTTALEKSQAKVRLDYKKIVVFSDPHYYASELGVSGSAFENYLAMDRKLLAESDAILRKMIEIIKAGDAGVVLIPGDLTKDGELVNHLKFASYLKELEDSGRKVYVINGNHDIYNPHAFSFDGDNVVPVATVSPEEFKDIYRDFGYDEAIACDPDSLSYVAEPVKGVRIICMDSALYTPSQPGESPVVGDGFSEARLQWILNQTREAGKKGKTVIGMMHHGLIEHFQGQKEFFEEYVVNDVNDQIVTRLAEAGMSVVFTGHFHAQDVVCRQIDDRNIYDVQTGSLVTYPNPYRVVELVGENKLKITSAAIESIEYNTGDMEFEDYSRMFLTEGIKGTIPYILAGLLIKQNPDMPQDVALQKGSELALVEVAPNLTVQDIMVNVIIIHYQGDEVVDPQLVAVLQGMSASEDPMVKMLGDALTAIGTDLEPADNDIILKPHKKV